MFRRVIWIVLDSVGIGEMPDAATYGDAGSDTRGNLALGHRIRSHRTERKVIQEDLISYASVSVIGR